MIDPLRWMAAVALAWAVLMPIWLATIVSLVFGRAHLSRDEVRKAVAQTILSSCAIGFPLAWAAYWYCARFNPSPSVSAVFVGGTWALVLLPLYSALFACAVFNFTAQAALTRGALSRGLAPRITATIALLVISLTALAGLGAACLFAAGPHALG